MRFVASIVFSLMFLFLGARVSEAGPLEEFKGAILAHQRGDYATAFRVYERLASQNFPGAQYALGAMYYEGKGVRRDYALALKWHMLAANNGYAPSQYEIGTFHDAGYGVPKNLVEAARWFRRSAEQGYGKAQINLGVMYAIGDGVQKDLMEAYKWFSVAARGGDFLDSERLKIDALKRKEALSRQITSAQRIEGEQRAQSWKAKAERQAQQETVSSQTSEVDAAAEFALKTCYEALDDASRVRSYARLMKWETLSGDMKNIMRPSGAGADYEAWLVAESNQWFIVSVHRGSFRGNPAEVCQVSTEVSSEQLVASIGRKVRIGSPTSGDLGMQQTSIYQLLQHPNVRLAFLIVVNSKDKKPFTIVSFMGVR